MRLIDADALEKDLSKLWEEMDDVDYGEYVRDANKMLNHYPTIEAVPVKPEVEHSGGGSTWWNVCGACKTAINPNDKYCHECGVSIDWRSDDDRTD